MQARLQVKRDSTEHWDNASGFIPLPGEIIVYDDYKTEEYKTFVNGELVLKTRVVPGIKIGSGNAYVQDLAFVDAELRQTLMDHINNQELHTTLQEKVFWNNKLNLDDRYEKVHDELEEETLILNRN